MLVARRNTNLMPTLFNELLNWDNWGNYANEEHYCAPKMNVTEDEQDYELQLCVPGLAKEDLDLSLDSEGNLVVEMVKKEEKQEETSRRVLRHEFGQAKFKQLLSLPENVKKEQISAKVENGILTIRLPKITEQEKQALAQRIEIL